MFRHQRGVLLQQRFVGPTNSSGTFHSHLPPPPLKVKSFKILKLKITYPHCCIKKPPLLHIHIRNTSGAVHQPAAIYEPKSSRPVKLSIFTHCVTEGAYRYVTVDAAMECAIYSFEI